MISTEPFHTIILYIIRSSKTVHVANVGSMKRRERHLTVTNQSTARTRVGYSEQRPYAPSE